MNLLKKYGFVLVLMHGVLFAAYKPHDTLSRWSFEFHLGGVYNFRTPLTIYQRGYPDIHIDRAKYSTEPFTSPQYWDWRFTKWFDRSGISFECIHHKLYLENRPPEVERFAISHGYNMCIFSYSRNFRWFNAAIGGGSVLMHPESTIRGKEMIETDGLKDYRLRGWVMNAAISHQVRIYKRFYLNTETKITFSQANVPIVDGHAKVNSIALQFIFGPGMDFGYAKKDRAGVE